jgi:predicted GTPase
MGMRQRVVILGAAGRDYHNFNIVFRGDARYDVRAFTANQIPGIADRRYPAALAGPLYPSGIGIRREADLETICRAEKIDEVYLAYSDLSHAEVMHLAARAQAAGASFHLLGPRQTMIAAGRPVIAVSAVRTGCGKSQTARWLVSELRRIGLRVSVIRHPMPYGDLQAQAVQRFATRADLDTARCTLEEREEYEPYVEQGVAVFAGVDYGRIVQIAAEEANLIVWDGGNNDFPFVRPDLHVVLVDALRPGHETAYYPGETVLRSADVVVIAKSDSAQAGDIALIESTVRTIRSEAIVVRGASPVTLDPPSDLRGRKVVVVEDGPTLTHGGMRTGAGFLAASRAGAVILDPRGFAAPGLATTLERYPHIGPVLPAMGYSPEEVESLRTSIDRSRAEIVVAGTPIDLATDLQPRIPVVRARYVYADAGQPTLWQAVERFLRRRSLHP